MRKIIWLLAGGLLAAGSLAIPARADAPAVSKSRHIAVTEQKRTSAESVAAALASLYVAKVNLKAAANDAGGHRDRAIAAINEAQAQLNAMAMPSVSPSAGQGESGQVKPPASNDGSIKKSSQGMPRQSVPSTGNATNNGSHS